jgi:hypothetical protein
VAFLGGAVRDWLNSVAIWDLNQLPKPDDLRSCLQENLKSRRFIFIDFSSHLLFPWCLRVRNLDSLYLIPDYFLIWVPWATIWSSFAGYHFTSRKNDYFLELRFATRGHPDV